MKRCSLAVAALAALALPGAAAAHGVEAEVERRGTSVAVRARYDDGRPLAGARYEVASPARPGRPHAEGRTDSEGRLAFSPDAPGTWTVRIADEGGHGRVVTVEIAPPPVEGAPAPPARAKAPAATGTIARTASGVAVLALVFGGLYAAARRRRGAGR